MNFLVNISGEAQQDPALSDRRDRGLYRPLHVRRPHHSRELQVNWPGTAYLTFFNIYKL